MIDQTRNVPKFGAQHFNAIAKDIRTEFKTWTDLDTDLEQISKKEIIMAVRALTDLALRLAKRFVEDNPLFDPVQFLNQCSPDENLYPLRELWNV